MTQTNGFIQSLLDFSFSKFVATKVVGIIYAIAIIVAVLVTAITIFSSFVSSLSSGLATLIIAPIVALIYLLLIRIGLESLVAGIRTAENTTQIKEYLKQIRDDNV